MDLPISAADVSSVAIRIQKSLCAVTAAKKCLSCENVLKAQFCYAVHVRLRSALGSCGRGFDARLGKYFLFFSGD